MNEIEQALADVEKEGSDPFAPLEETPSESPTEKKEDEVEEPKVEIPEENIPFHKHPRWIERENELNSLKEREEEMARELAELKTFREQSSRSEPADIPEWFKELYGENPVAWQKYSEHEESRIAEIEARVLARQEEERTRAVQESERWNKWVDSEIGKLEADGLTFDRNKLINTMLEYRPTDENNNFDFKAGYKIYEALEGKPDTAKSEARKQLADTTTKATTKGDPTQKDYMTPAELRSRSMTSL